MRATVDFLLHDWLNVNALTARARFADHSAETFAQVLDTCERIAREKYAPFNRLVDTDEPRFDGEKVILPQATHDAWKAYAESGMLSAAQDYDIGGMQLPYTVEAAANAFFAKASVSIGAGMLTVGNANLLMAHGTALQKQVFALNEFSGRFSGTMCLSEPQAGSSLSDVATRAVPDGADFEADPLGPRFRLRGNKMWISAGEHELSENIIHLVLAKIPGPDGKTIPGARGISLFIVPKKLVDAEGRLTGERNDVALAGLNHKCGWRGTTNTLLNFGEGKFKVRGEPGAVGYLVGKPGEGLRCMFHMMNEARIGVGMAATMLGMAGYEASLDYAKNRPQGRPVGPAGKDPAQPPIPIIQHADVKRMLLAQKAYAEGALALELYCARLVDEQHTGDAAAGGADADRQELAQRVVPGRQFAGDPGARRLRLHARLPGRAVLARPAPEHDPRGHARHPGAGPAGPQGRDGRWRRAQAAGIESERHDRMRRPRRRLRRARQRAGGRAAEAGRGHEGRLGDRRAGRGAGERHAVPAGLRPRRAGVDLARGRPGGESRTGDAGRPDAR
jgi:butyryl-CoA dehydrogenase